MSSKFDNSKADIGRKEGGGACIYKTYNSYYLYSVPYFMSVSDIYIYIKSVPTVLANLVFAYEIYL